MKIFILTFVFLFTGAITTVEFLESYFSETQVGISSTSCGVSSSTTVEEKFDNLPGPAPPKVISPERWGSQPQSQIIKPEVQNCVATCNVVYNNNCGYVRGQPVRNVARVFYNRRPVRIIWV